MLLQSLGSTVPGREDVEMGNQGEGDRVLKQYCEATATLADDSAPALARLAAAAVADGLLASALNLVFLPQTAAAQAPGLAQGRVEASLRDVWSSLQNQAADWPVQLAQARVLLRASSLLAGACPPGGGDLRRRRVPLTAKQRKTRAPSLSRRRKVVTSTQDDLAKTLCPFSDEQAPSTVHYSRLPQRLAPSPAVVLRSVLDTVLTRSGPKEDPCGAQQAQETSLAEAHGAVLPVSSQDAQETPGLLLARWALQGDTEGGGLGGTVTVVGKSESIAEQGERNPAPTLQEPSRPESEQLGPSTTELGSPKASQNEEAAGGGTEGTPPRESAAARSIGAKPTTSPPSQRGSVAGENATPKTAAPAPESPPVGRGDRSPMPEHSPALCSRDSTTPAVKAEADGNSGGASIQDAPEIKTEAGGGNASSQELQQATAQSKNSSQNQAGGTNVETQRSPPNKQAESKLGAAAGADDQGTKRVPLAGGATGESTPQPMDRDSDSEEAKNLLPEPQRPPAEAAQATSESPAFAEEALGLVLGSLQAHHVCRDCATCLAPCASLLFILTASPRRWLRTRALQVLASLASVGIAPSDQSTKKALWERVWSERASADSAAGVAEGGRAGKKDGESDPGAMQVDGAPSFGHAEYATAMAGVSSKLRLMADASTGRMRRRVLSCARFMVLDPAPVVRAAALDAMTMLLVKDQKCRPSGRELFHSSGESAWIAFDAVVGSFKDSDLAVRKAAVCALTSLALCSPETPWKEAHLPVASAPSCASQWEGISERHALGLPTLAFLCLSELCTDMRREVRQLVLLKLGELRGLVHPGHLAQGFFKRLRTGQADAEHRAHGAVDEHGSPGLHEWGGAEVERAGHGVHDDRRPSKRVKSEAAEEGPGTGSKLRESDEKRPPQDEVSPLRGALSEAGEGEIKRQEKELRLLRERAAGAFIHGMEDSAKETRIAVLRSVASLITHSTLEAAEEALPHILDEISDETPDVRLEALHTLAKVVRKWGSGLRLGDSEKISSPAAALSDLLPAVRDAARELLSAIRVGSKQALLLVMDLLLAAVLKWPSEHDKYLAVAASIGTSSAAAVNASTPELLSQAQERVMQLRPGRGVTNETGLRGYSVLLCILLSAATALPMCVRPQIPSEMLQHFALYLPVEIYKQAVL